MSQEGYRANGWPGVKQLFDNWLQILQREVGQPNLWAGILDADLPSSPSSNAPLTADEVEYVRGQIDSARKYLHGQNLDKQTLDSVNKKLDYLVGASKRMGRIDWRTLAIGTVVEIAISAAFAPEQAQALFQLITAPVQRLLTGA